MHTATRTLGLLVLGAWLLAAVPAALALSPSDLPSGPPPPATPRSDGSSAPLLVGFRDGTSAARRRAVIRKVSGVRDGQVGRLPVDRVQPGSGLSRAGLKARLLRRPEVRFVEPDYDLTVSTEPNDFYYPLQWGLNPDSGVGTSATSAWSERTSCSKVAVLDTGIDYTHPDLKDNIWKNSKETPNNGRDDDDNGYVDDYYGVDIRKGSGSGADDNGHGTHVAGIIGARGNNSTGVTGVCWSASVMAVKFMGAGGSGRMSDAAEGIEYATRKGAKVINASFGADEKSSTLEEAIDYAKENGVLIVTAAGNDGRDADSSPVYPGSYSDGNILNVAATTDADKLASFSNYGDSSVDVGAPGEDIASTAMGGGYMLMSGTSMAAPYAAGMAAMLRAENSGAATYSNLRTGIRQKVDKPSALSNKVVYDGRVDVNRALYYIQSK